MAVFDGSGNLMDDYDTLEFGAAQVARNDDGANAAGFCSSLSMAGPLTAGTYYIGLVGFGSNTQNFAEYYIDITLQ